MGSRRRRRRNEIARYSLNEYVRKRVEAIENNPYAFAYSTPSATYRGKYVEKVEDSYASLASYAYRGDSVVAACMRVRRDLFRQAKFCWREIDEAGPGKIFRTDELDLLDRPWPNGTTGELLARMITDVDLCGNSFIHHEGSRLRWLRPDWVSIVLSGDPEADPDIDVLGYVYTPGGKDPEKNGVAYQPDDICHWAPEQDPMAFYRGMSWVSKALEEVQGDRAATNHKMAFFRNGATLGPIVRVPAGTSLQQFKEFMAAAEEAHAGAHNAYKTLYLGGGAEVTLAAADFRQLDLKSVQGGMETRIAAVAGVHPVLVGLSEGLAGSSLNSGNFAAARRATAEMTLYSLWQDACGALQAFFKVPDRAELWIRERDIPFLREEARDRAEIFKTQVLAIEAAMRAGFKPDPAVQATLEERLDLLIGNHTGLFSVQMQPPQAGQAGVPPLDVNGDGQPDEPGAPIDFGALRADLWEFDEEDIERAVEDLFADLADLEDVHDEDVDDEAERARYDVRVPAGFEGGGRFRKLSDRLVSLLNDWAKGEGDDDPLDQFSRDQLRRVAKELADKAAAAGDHDRAARLTPRRGASSDEIKLALYKDVRGVVREKRDTRAETGNKAKFTLQSGTRKGLDVAVYRQPGDKPALYRENDQGKRGRLVKKFDSLDDMAAWADDNGEPHVAEWARAEGGRGKPEAPSTPGPDLTGANGLSADPAVREVQVENRIRAAKTRAVTKDRVLDASDPEALRDALDLRTVDQLKAMLRGRGLPVSGRKRELVDRLVGGGGVGPKGEVPRKAASAKPGRAPATPVPIRDLFAADDATIETALKDVFEGKFGPYTTKASVGVRRAGTRTDSRGREKAFGPRIDIGGKIFDEQGREIGYFSRSISPVDLHYQDGTVRREMWAEHEIVQLGEGDYDDAPTRYHGKGFGGEFNRRAIQWYRDSGVHGISQNDHNGYVWASQGFNFGGGIVPDYLAANMRQLIADLRTGKRTSDATKDEYHTIPKRFRDAPDLDAQIAAAEALLARLARTKPGDPDYPTAYEISQLGRRAGQRGKTALWLGKLLFVSADEMILNPDEGEVLSQ